MIVPFFIFAEFHLLARQDTEFVGMLHRSVERVAKRRESVRKILSMDVSGAKIKDKKQRALDLLDSVGLDEDEANRRVLKLSGGQQQRVAIARTVIRSRHVTYSPTLQTILEKSMRP